MSNEKFCLRWNDFESNISSAFREIREDKEFFDVTLASDDDNQIQAHKVIIGACSPFFRNILRKNSHNHPLLYLKGVKYKELVSVLNFMYMGEVNVAQDDLNSFLAVAEELRVKGNDLATLRALKTYLPRSDPKHLWRRRLLQQLLPASEVLLPPLPPPAKRGTPPHSLLEHLLLLLLHPQRPSHKTSSPTSSSSSSSTSRPASRRGGGRDPRVRSSQVRARRPAAGDL